MECINQKYSKDQTDLILTFRDDEDYDLEPLTINYIIDNDSGSLYSLMPDEWAYKKEIIALKAAEDFNDLEDMLVDGGYIWKSVDLDDRNHQGNRPPKGLYDSKNNSRYDEENTGYSEAGSNDIFAYLMGLPVKEDNKVEARTVQRNRSGLSVSFSDNLAGMLK